MACGKLLTPQRDLKPRGQGTETHPISGWDSQQADSAALSLAPFPASGASEDAKVVLCSPGLGPAAAAGLWARDTHPLLRLGHLLFGAVRGPGRQALSGLGGNGVQRCLGGPKAWWPLAQPHEKSRHHADDPQG